MRRRRLLLWASLAVLALLLATARAEEVAGDEGHKRPYVHRILLRDKDGAPIRPASTVPYSPRKTCSGPECHNYETIAQGLHFDMGKAQMADDWGKRHGEPWHLSPGMAGGYLPTFRRQYARKKNASAAAIDMTAYEFVKACGTCHPGGGAMETDRDGQRFDARQKADPALAESLDGDYHQAKWDRSGVVEIDCLMCHAQWPYDNDERGRQLQAENYAYAATAAAGFGTVQGKVADLRPAAEEEDLPPDMRADAEGQATVAVQYPKRLFDGQDHVTLDIGRPKDQSCLFCHHLPALKGARGWEHRHWRDVHTAQGIACVDCHSAEEDHQFELGRKLHWSVRDTAVEPMTCARCHNEGHLGAPRPRHAGFPRFHFDRIACVTCHSGPALTVKGERVDHVLTDTSSSTPSAAGQETAYPDQQAPWQIVYEPRGGQVRVHNAQVPVWWGQIVDEETVWPLFLREVAPAIQAVGDAIEDDDGDGVPEVNRRDEIIAVDHALRESLQGGRFAEPRPVLVKGTHAHWADHERVRDRDDHPQARPLQIPIAHVVRGPQEALGARSCTECHSLDSYLFSGRRITNPYNDRGKLNDRSMRRWLDILPSRIRLGAFREGILKPYGLLLIPLTVLACLLHYVLFGPKRVHHDTPDDEVKRFGRFERIVHLLQLSAFLVLAVTGLGFILASQWRGGMSYLWRTATAELLHQGVGYVFLVTSVLLIVRWAPTAVFRDYDFQWFRVMGGYLWLKGKAPAGKFNAGQKLLFWLLAVAVLLLGASGILMALRPASLDHWMGHIYTLHGLMAVLIVPAIIGHVYLGTICNPGAFRSIFEGKVTRAWAAKHHPNWLEETGEAPPEAGGK